MAGRAATGFEQVEETRFLLNQPFPNGASLKRLTFFLTDVRRPALPAFSHSPAACRLAEPLAAWLWPAPASAPARASG